MMDDEDEDEDGEDDDEECRVDDDEVVDDADVEDSSGPFLFIEPCNNAQPRASRREIRLSRSANQSRAAQQQK
jgi:hypothetical protein